MSPSVKEFDHYEPANYLLGVGSEAEGSLPGLDEALDRFEQMFKKLNSLLPQS